MRFNWFLVGLVAVLASCDLVGQSDVVQLDVQVTPGNAGTTSPPSREYNAGERVTLRAVHGFQSGYLFQKWGGDLESRENPVTFRIESDMQIVAHFVPKPWTLTIQVVGEGDVQHRVAGSGMPYQDGPEGSYGNSLQLELLANPASGWELDHWWGENFNLRSTDNPVVFGIWRDQVVTVHFREVNP